MVRTADAAVANIKSEAASLQAEIDSTDSQIGLRELDRRAAAQKSYEEEIAAKRRALTVSRREGPRSIRSKVCKTNGRRRVTGLSGMVRMLSCSKPGQVPSGQMTGLMMGRCRCWS